MSLIDAIFFSFTITTLLICMVALFYAMKFMNHRLNNKESIKEHYNGFYDFLFEKTGHKLKLIGLVTLTSFLLLILLLTLAM